MTNFIAENVDAGILYYSKSNETIRVRALHNEVSGLMQMRNQYTCSLGSLSELPPTLINSDLCNRCYAADECMIAHKVGNFV